MDRNNPASGTCPPDYLLTELGVMSEEQMIALAKITPGTALAWRKRGEGPPWLRVGNAVYYPVSGTREYLQSKVRLPSGAAVHVL